MNKYDDKFIFRKAQKSDLNDIASFFDLVWKKGGILSDVSFLEYEFSGKGEDVNLILAINKKGGKIQGLWGYYPFSSEYNVLDVAGGPWSVKQDKNCIPFLGIEIMIRAKELIGYRSMLGIGDNKDTSGFYHRRIRKDIVGRLNHYYMLNTKERYEIAVIRKIPENLMIYPSNFEINCRSINNYEDIDDGFWNKIEKKQIPFKDKEYIIKRFFKHPVYKYKVIGIYHDGILGAIFFMRMIYEGTSCVNRIVDYIGEKKYIIGIGDYLKTYMEKEQCEYTDFYNFGFDKELMLKAGFAERVENDINIIPNYFEPFEQKNVEIYFSAPVSNITLCKADGDQDRPNYKRGSGRECLEESVV